MHQYCTWRDLAEVLCYPPTYAPTLCNIAAGKPGQVTPEGEQELRKRLGLSHDVRYIVDVPADHDAAVHLHPGGNGELHTYTVPADAEVVIVPAGARIVKPKPAQPKRKRTRIDITGLPLNAQEAREVLLWWLFRDKRDDWPDWLTRPQAEDTGTDPAEVATVLARLD